MQNGFETILNALEKARIEAPSKYRSGECGFCKSRLISDSTFIKRKVTVEEQAINYSDIFIHVQPIPCQIFK